MTSYIIRSSILGTAALIALIFVPAGTVNYWQGWAYVAVWIISGGSYTAYLVKHDPGLLKRRSEAGISYEKEPAQKVIILFLFVGFVALIILPPLDVRFGWSSVHRRIGWGVAYGPAADGHRSRNRSCPPGSSAHPDRSSASSV